MEATEYIAGIRVGKWMLQTKVASYIGCVRKDEHADGGRVLEETEVRAVTPVAFIAVATVWTRDCQKEQRN